MTVYTSWMGVASGDEAAVATPPRVGTWAIDVCIAMRRGGMRAVRLLGSAAVSREMITLHIRYTYMYRG